MHGVTWPGELTGGGQWDLANWLAILSAGLKVPLWVMDTDGKVMVEGADPFVPCCDVYGENRAECAAFRSALSADPLRMANTAIKQCPHGLTFMAARLPGGGAVQGLLVAGGYVTEPRRQGEYPEVAVPLLRAGDQVALSALLSGLCGVVKETVAQALVAKRLTTFASLVSVASARPPGPGLLQDLMDMAVEQACLIPGLEAMVVGGQDGTRARIMAWQGKTGGPHKGFEFPLGTTLEAWVIRTGQELLISDVALDPMAAPPVPGLNLESQAWFLAPVLVYGQALGVLVVGWPNKGTPAGIEMAFVRAIAMSLGLVWTRINLFTRLYRQERQFAPLKGILAQPQHIMRAPDFLLDLFAATFELAGARLVDADPGLRAGVKHAEGYDFTGLAGSRPEAGGHEPESFMLPLSGKVLSLTPGKVPLSDWDQLTLRLWFFIVDVTAALHCSEGHSPLALGEVVGLLAELLGQVDPAAREFGEQAARLVGQMLPHLAVDGPTGERIQYAARLIQIGVAGLRSGGSAGPGGIGYAGECSLVQRGADLLPASGAWADVREAIRCQQERWDGGGPSGMAGQAIPLGARVLAVVCHFMRSGGGQSERVVPSLAEVERGSGVHFDPAVVRALVLALFPGSAKARLPGSGPDSAPGQKQVTDSTGDGKDAGMPPGLGSLTDRELEVLGLVAEGHSNRDIAQMLYLSEATVKTHVSRILRKLAVESRSKASRIYLEFRNGSRALHPNNEQKVTLRVTLPKH